MSGDHGGAVHAEKIKPYGKSQIVSVLIELEDQNVLQGSYQVAGLARDLVFHLDHCQVQGQSQHTFVILSEAFSTRRRKDYRGLSPHKGEHAEPHQCAWAVLARCVRARIIGHRFLRRLSTCAWCGGRATGSNSSGCSSACATCSSKKMPSPQLHSSQSRTLSGWASFFAGASYFFFLQQGLMSTMVGVRLCT